MSAAGEPRAASRMADLGPRVASAVVMIAAALTTAWVGGRWFTLFWLAAGLAIHWEWQRLIGGARQGARFALGAGALAAIAAAVDNAAPDVAVAIAVANALAMAGLAGQGLGQGLRLWAGAGALYAAALVIAVLFLRGSLFAGFEAILWLFATVWGTDVMAYFGGRIVGGPKLWPRVSPSKTWSGFLIGVFCGALAGMAVAPHNAAILPLFAFTALAAALSQGGDLFESSVKRHFGVKDASRLIPGHGGVMDRLDGFIAAAAFAAIVAFARAGYASPAQSLFFW